MRRAIPALDAAVVEAQAHLLAVTLEVAQADVLADVPGRALLVRLGFEALDLGGQRAQFGLVGAGGGFEERLDLVALELDLGLEAWRS